MIAQRLADKIRLGRKRKTRNRLAPYADAVTTAPKRISVPVDRPANRTDPSRPRS